MDQSNGSNPSDLNSRITRLIAEKGANACEEIEGIVKKTGHRGPALYGLRMLARLGYGDVRLIELANAYNTNLTVQVAQRVPPHLSDRPELIHRDLPYITHIYIDNPGGQGQELRIIPLS